MRKMKVHFSKTLAAMLSEEKIIGMVGGMDMPVIRNFYVGYEAG